MALYSTQVSLFHNFSSEAKGERGGKRMPMLILNELNVQVTGNVVGLVGEVELWYVWYFPKIPTGLLPTTNMHDKAHEGKKGYLEMLKMVGSDEN